MKKVRTRFAPSPTGYMHIGNLRTALYAYLLARKHGGSFVLRIEDTDCDRKVEGAVELIYETLKKAGLYWDEGPDVGGNYGPYVQSQRMEIFKRYADELIEKGFAYPCFCTKARLDRVRELQKAAKLVPKYDGCCRNLTKQQIEQNLNSGLPFVVRQKMPIVGQTRFFDEVFGEVVVDNSNLDDQVLVKSDGMPTYNFANVVDDHLMQISHVIRGSEYLSSTPKYNLLYEAFGWDKPKYIHCSPVMKDSHTKFSKRNGDATFDDLLNQGFLPSAIVNYIVLLGWSSKSVREIYSLSELVEVFDVAGIVKSPAIFDFKKLLAFNSIYIKALSDDEFLNLAGSYMHSAVKSNVDFRFLAKMLKSRVNVFSEIAEQVDFVDELPSFDLSLFVNKKMKTTLEISLKSLEAVLPVFEGLINFDFDSVHDAAFGVIERLGLKNGQLLWPIRTALSGKQFTPGGGIELACLLKKDESLKRIQQSIERLRRELGV